jgi:hypothetical protein
VRNVNAFVNTNETLGHFFKDKRSYIQEMARKAAAIGDKEIAEKTFKISLHQQVIYCGK